MSKVSFQVPDECMSVDVSPVNCYNECVNLSAFVHNFNPVIYYCG